jgi:4-hydroxy-2-oxoheptanedioate aldolase
MAAPENILKKRLAAGEVVFGCWLAMGDAYAAEIAATAGFDWLLFDGEHAPNDIRSLSAQVAVVLPSACAAVMRPVNDDPALIKQLLDIGAQSLLVPMVESADQARAILRATRYAPQGMRGVGASFARASQFNAVNDYVTTANAQICLILQVENRAGLAALDEILTIDGVDGVFIGPADLAADLGHPGNATHPEVRAAVHDALRRIRAAGKSAGVLATDPEFVDECLASGANFVGVGIDVLLYAGALRSLAANYRGTV